MIKDNAVTVYGQDYSPVDDAWVTWVELDDVGREIPQKVQFSGCRDSIRESIYSFLTRIESRLFRRDLVDVIVVGHSDDKTNIGGTNRKKDWHIINDYHGDIRFGSLVGTIRGMCVSESDDSDVADRSETDDAGFPLLIKVVIFSRFDSRDEMDLVQAPPYFLASLLLKGNLAFESYFNVDFNYDALFEFYMLWQLKKQLQEAMYKGFYRQYQRFEKNDDRFRGRIDVARHMRLNHGANNGRISYEYRENTVDNVVNHLLICAYDYLSEKYPQIVEANFNDDLVNRLNMLRYEIGYPRYSLNELMNKNTEPISHPYYSEYRDLQKTCLMILRDEAVSPFGGDEEEVDGILYYVPDLWEEYLSDRLRDTLQNRGVYSKLTLVTQMYIPIMTSLHDSESVDLGDYDERQKNKSYPDFVFFDDGVPFCILDAKYKAHWKDSLKGKLYYRDDYDKCIRDMTSVSGTSCGVIFPLLKTDIDDTEIQIDHYFSDYNKFGNFYTFPIYVPPTKVHRRKSKEETEPFKEWFNRMDSSVKTSMKMIVECLELEASRKRTYDDATNNTLITLERHEFGDEGYAHYLANLGLKWLGSLKNNKKLSKDLKNKE